jgi:hypothetical protein
MGLLDDAIREHLDLKRRRGADPGEVEQAEREALGPVRRDPFEHSDEEPEGREPAYDQALEDEHGDHEEQIFHDADGDWSDVFDEEAEHAPAEPVPDEPRTSVLAEEPPEPVAAEPLVDDHDRPAPTERVADEPHPAEASVGEETVEYDVEQELAEQSGRAAPREPERPQAPPKTKEEDVLEETPEFLQDTPDHDRLWFEQRPPRDFDFDG